jgi:hypothetical protein
MKDYKEVLEIVKGCEDEVILNDFKNDFKVGSIISKDEYKEFFMKYVNGGCDEEYYIEENWNS